MILVSAMLFVRRKEEQSGGKRGRRSCEESWHHRDEQQRPDDGRELNLKPFLCSSSLPHFFTFSPFALSHLPPPPQSFMCSLLFLKTYFHVRAQCQPPYSSCTSCTSRVVRPCVSSVRLLASFNRACCLSGRSC